MRERGLCMKWILLPIAACAVSACASPDHPVADALDPLAAPPQNESLNQQILREGQGDGCLTAGNAGSLRPECRELRDTLSPPEFPQDIVFPPPPPPRERPDDD